MKITRTQCDDKLHLFVLAGIAKSHSGWDYAIPQYWCDQLTKMGIEHPARWFAADCTGPMAFPVLHHIGEAYVAITSNRQKENEEIFMALFEEMQTTTTPDKEDKDFYDFFINDDQARAEADAGFLDVNLIMRAFHAGRACGLKSPVSESEYNKSQES